MRNLVLIFGLIAGLICGAMFFIMHPGDEPMDFSQGAIYGYVTMFIALSSIFFAVKQYRDKHNGGTIKFGKSFLIGLYITLIAGVIYYLCWEYYFTNFAPDFGDQYIAYLETQMTADGMSATEITKELADTKTMMDTYSSNMLMRAGMTLMEIVPVGLLISLISALVFGVFLKKKDAYL